MVFPRYIAILGVGHCVPETVRTNDDPVFDWINAHAPKNKDLFAGLKNRRVLANGETVVGLMQTAAERALKHAELDVSDIDMILGAGSVSESYAPNVLCEVHQALNLSHRCRVMPIQSEYTNFQDAMKLANDLIAARTIKNALVVCGQNWTRHVYYHESVCIAAGDGAGAAVVGRTGDATKFRLVDWENETDTSWLGAFRMKARETDNPQGEYGSFTRPLMKLGENGPTAFKEFGLIAPPAVTQTLLSRHGLIGSDISLVAHQTSAVVYDAWRAAIEPGFYASTLEEYADMVSSSAPVNLSVCYAELPTDNLVLLGVGMEMHATALLYVRDRPTAS